MPEVVEPDTGEAVPVPDQGEALAQVQGSTGVPYRGGEDEPDVDPSRASVELVGGLTCPTP